MKLSDDEKEALSEHFRDMDLYDPSKDPAQDPPTMQSHGKSTGGMVQSYQDGGEVTDGLPWMPRGGPAGAVGEEPEVEAQPPVEITAPSQVMDSLNAFTGAPNGAKQDEFSALIAGLQPSMGRRVGQGAMSGIAGLADAIESGVARAPGPGFQRAIAEKQGNQRRDLIDALTKKYEVGHRTAELEQGQQRIGIEGQRAAEEARSHGATEKQAADALAAENERAAKALGGENARSKAVINAENERARMEVGIRAQEAQAGRAQSGIEAAAKLPATGFLHPSTWGRGKDIEQVREQLLRQGQGGAATTPMTATNKMGHKIISVDGGKTWKAAQ